MKKKKNYDISHKVMRVRVVDYTLLAEISRVAGVPMAEALHLLITNQVKREATVETPSQIPMPGLRVTAPVAFKVSPRPTISINGSKVAAFKIKPKGVRYE